MKSRTESPKDGALDPIAESLNALRRRGFGRLLVGGQAVPFEEINPASLRGQTTLEVVVDRVRIDGDLRSRLTDSIETSYPGRWRAPPSLSCCGIRIRASATRPESRLPPNPQSRIPSPVPVEFRRVPMSPSSRSPIKFQAF